MIKIKILLKIIRIIYIMPVCDARPKTCVF